MSHQATIPAETREQFSQLADLLERASRLARGLSEGKAIPFTPSIPKLIRPAHIPEDEEWFWSEEWQAGEREVNEALKRGEYQEFKAVEEAIADLHRHL